MTKLLPPLLALVALLGTARAAEYQAVPNWYHLQEGRPQIGNCHGDVAVSSEGDIYVSVMDPKAAMQVYGADGTFKRLVPNAPPDFHGFVIHKDADGEFIFGPRVGAGHILKLKLDGEVVLDIPPDAIPDEFKNKDKEGKPTLKLTAMDVAPNGDLYVTDGYSSDYIHRFDKTGKYLTSFGGKKAPYNFSTAHKIAIDTRFTPARIIVCDRANGRVVHLSLEGEVLGVVATGLRLPAAIVIHGDHAIVGELGGRITVLDKEGKTVATPSEDDIVAERGNNRTEPDKWRPGIVTAPHGVACDAKGDIYVAEYSLYGRIHRFDLK